MARMEAIGMQTDDFLELNPDELCLEALEEAAPVLENSMKAAISSAIRHKDKSTGDLVKSIKARKPKKDKNGNYMVFVGPSGYSKNRYYDKRSGKRGKSRELSNAAKLIWMEYGRKGQNPTPVLAKSTRDAENEAYQRMQNVFDRKA